MILVTPEGGYLRIDPSTPQPYGALLGQPPGKAIDIVTGFIDGEKARGRPVGLALDKTGALLIADDLGNAVWRVSAC